MMYARLLAICAVWMLCSTHALEGLGPSNYRHFEVGSDVASVASLASIASAQMQTIHQRPALLQDLEWRPSRWSVGSTAASTEPVEQILFSFYDDQLFRIVVGSGHDRTAGMIGPDMIEAISAVYGTTVVRAGRSARVGSRVETESGSPLARWGNSEHAIVLYQTPSYRPTYRLIVTDTRLDDFARKAESEAVRLKSASGKQKRVSTVSEERWSASSLC